jgi:hypothetical protein
MILVDASAFSPTAETANILAISLLALGITIAIRALTKLKVYGNPTPEGLAKRKEANFDIARNGIDLSLLGLSAYLSILEIVKRKAPNALGDMIEWNTAIILTQVLLLIIITFLTGMYDSPNDGWGKGVWLPMFLGWISVSISAIIFISVVR